MTLPFKGGATRADDSVCRRGDAGHRRLGHAALDDQAVQLNAREARQRQFVAVRQLAGDRLDLGDLLRWENGAGGA